MHDVAALGESGAPRVRGVTFDRQTAGPLGRGPGVEPALRTVQRPPAGVHRGRRALTVVEQPGGQLQEDLRLGVAAHRAEHRQRARRPRVASAGESVCGGRRPGPYSAGCPAPQREADATVVEVDAGVRLDEPRAEPGRVRLDQRHAHPVRCRRCRGRWCRRRGRATDRRPARCGSIRLDRASIAASSASPSAPFVQHVGTVEPGGGRRLDQQVRPLRVVGVVGEAELRSPDEPLRA